MNKIAGPIPGTTFEYVPTSLGNKERAVPVVVTLKVPTRGARRKYQWLLQSAGYVDAVEAAIRSDVVFVRGYAGEDGKPIETAAQFADHGQDEFVFEVGAKLLNPDSLSEDQANLSGKPSD